MKNILNGINIKWDIIEKNYKYEGRIVYSKIYVEKYFLKNRKIIREVGIILSNLIYM